MRAIADERPVFIVGCPRSGTTLLSAMLHAHPRIAIPPETRFLLPAYAARHSFGDLRLRANRLRLARQITGRGSRFADLGLSRPAVIAAISDGPPTLGSAVAIVWREFARSRGKARWGEKRPAYWRHMHLIDAMFPNAQILHLVRDPRSCVASLQELAWYRMSLEEACAVWVLADQELRRFGRGRPDRYHALRYEDLVAEPAGQLADVCAFLGEDFDPAMLDHAKAAHDIVPGRKTWHDRTKDSLDPSRREAWRSALTPEQVGLVELVTRRGLRRWDYRPSGAGAAPNPATVASYAAVLARRRTAIERERLAIRWSLRGRQDAIASQI